MKTKITYLTIIAASILAFSNTNAQSLRIKGGMNLSNMVIEDNDNTYSENFENRLGYQIGITVQTTNENIISFEGGVNFGTRGYNYSESVVIEGMNMKVEQEMRLLYFNMPLTAKATIDLGKAKLYGAFGPYLALGLKGEIWSKASADGYSEESTDNILWGTDENDDYLMRFDGGLHTGVGIEFSNVELGLEYSYGLANISSYTENGSRIRNQNIGITLAYKILGGY
ncbi:MAG: porin family protein [Bacteroidota bacterium]